MAPSQGIALDANLQQPAPAPVPTPQASPQPSVQEMIQYNQNIKLKENQLSMMIGNLMSSKYMPTRDQMIQLLTTVITLVLMLYLGPVMGANAGLIQSIVKQVVPLVVSYGVHYAADQAVPVQQIDAPITQVQLQPVQVPQSQLIQAI